MNKKNIKKIITGIIIGLIGLFFLMNFIKLVTFDYTDHVTNGDQAHHYMQTMSLAYDLDLEYTKEDIDRFFEHPLNKNGPYGLFLKKIDERYYFAKPFLYHGFCAPLTRIFKEYGCNITMFLLSIVIFFMIYLWIRRNNDTITSLVVAFAFLFFSNYFFYVFEVHVNIFYSFLLFLPFFIILYPKKLKPYLVIIAAVILGLAIYEKLPFLLFLPAFIIILWPRTEKKWILAFLGITLGSWLIPTSYHLFQDGNFNTYSGERYYVINNYPFYSEGEFQGDLSNTGTERYKEFFIDIFSFINKEFFYNCFYFFFGRKTGIFYWNFPAILIFIYSIIRVVKTKRPFAELSIYIGVILYAAFNFIIAPDFYFGGGRTGSRYFLQIYLPLIFILSTKITGLKYYALSLLVPTFFLNTILLNPIIGDKLIERHQVMKNYPMTLVPPEKTFLWRMFPDQDNQEYRYGNKKIMAYVLDNDSQFLPRQNRYRLQQGSKTKLFIIASHSEIQNLPITFSAKKHTEISINNKSFRIKANEDITIESYELENTGVIFGSPIYSLEIKNLNKDIPVFFKFEIEEIELKTPNHSSKK